MWSFETDPDYQKKLDWVMRVVKDEVEPLVRHLVETRQLTGGLVLRALVAGNLCFFVEALAQLSGYDRRRVEAIVSDRSGHGFEALYRQSGLPRAALRGAASERKPGGSSGVARPPLTFSQRAVTSSRSVMAGLYVRRHYRRNKWNP